MLLTRRQPDKPAAATNRFCSIRTLNGVYTEFGIDPSQGGRGPVGGYHYPISLVPYSVRPLHASSISPDGAVDWLSVNSPYSPYLRI